jgi:hypothetical protein
MLNKTKPRLPSPGGHMKYPRGKFKRFIGGNGCKKHDNCLTCPFEPNDCKWGNPNDK